MSTIRMALKPFTISSLTPSRFIHLSQRRSKGGIEGIIKKFSNLSEISQRLPEDILLKRIYYRMSPSEIKSADMAVIDEINKFDLSHTPFPDLHLVQDQMRIEKSNSEVLTNYRLRKHPLTVINYWKIAQVMHRKGLIPFVHGQPSQFLIPQRVINALGFNQKQSIRFPGRDALKTRAKILELMEFTSKNPKSTKLLMGVTEHKEFFDHKLRDSLLSTTIGLFHYESDESPASFVFGGGTGTEWSKTDFGGNRSILSKKECKKISDRMIAQAMQEKGFDDEAIRNALKIIDPLYEQAEKLKMGQLIVLGIPVQKLHRYVYHSHAFGLTTDISVDKVLEKISNSKIPFQGCQARVILSKEFMDSESGIEIVNVMDETAVEKFCEGQPFVVPLQNGLLRWFINEPAEISKENLFEKTFSYLFCENDDFSEGESRREFNLLKNSIDKVIEQLFQKKSMHENRF